MKYLKLTNGVPESYSIHQLMKDNQSISFPEAPSHSLLLDFYVHPYERPDVPDYDHLLARVVDGGFEVDGSGKWTLPYVVEQLPISAASENVRQKRNILLQQTDWMALSDVTMSAQWAAYRQALRDITSQSAFPYGVVWPVKPE